MRNGWLILAMATMALAGCTDASDDSVGIASYDEPTTCVSAEPAHDMDDIAMVSGAIQAGLITPHVWNVCSSSETMLLWVHNGMDSAVTLGLETVTVPDGWLLEFEDNQLTLEAEGSRSGRQYNDWGHTLMHLQVPEDATGVHDLAINVGGVEIQFSAVIQEERSDVIVAGNKVTVTFDGRFTDDNEQFWDGTIPGIRVGDGQLISGVDFGLMGLGYGETAHLIVPPALAYGYDNPDGSGYEQFNGEWLTFIVTADQIES